MRMRFVTAAVAVVAALFCISLAGARAGDAPPVTDPPHYAPASDPTFKPSKVIDGTHDCSAYYPAMDLVQQSGGTVLLQFDVGADGVISNVRLLKTSGSDIVDQAALTCVREKWRNTPATQNGIPVPTPGHRAYVRFTIAPQ